MQCIECGSVWDLQDERCYDCNAKLSESDYKKLQEQRGITPKPTPTNKESKPMAKKKTTVKKTQHPAQLVKWGIKYKDGEREDIMLPIGDVFMEVAVKVNDLGHSLECFEGDILMSDYRELMVLRNKLKVAIESLGGEL